MQERGRKERKWKRREEKEGKGRDEKEREEKRWNGMGKERK